MAEDDLAPANDSLERELFLDGHRAGVGKAMEALALSVEVEGPEQIVPFASVSLASSHHHLTRCLLSCHSSTNQKFTISSLKISRNAVTPSLPPFKHTACLPS